MIDSDPSREIAGPDGFMDIKFERTADIDTEHVAVHNRHHMDGVLDGRNSDFRNLLDIQQDKLDVSLQRLYFSK